MKCYLLAVVSGSSLDQHSNNITLFNLVEQLNFPPHAHPPPGALLPLEIHAYFQLLPHEINQRFDLRFALAENSGLETVTEPFLHKSATPRYRTRTLGVPAPPGPGSYELRIDFRVSGSEAWTRDSESWPLLVVHPEQRPSVTH
ncbi:MAG TPA: hypothetical protein VGP93_01980 [Polyangiaceae bacterium]|jgi:hypothetical protein|nr:hypothetical protein [Polyangiaceae bacterium]